MPQNTYEEFKEKQEKSGREEDPSYLHAAEEREAKENERAQEQKEEEEQNRAEEFNQQSRMQQMRQRVVQEARKRLQKQFVKQGAKAGARGVAGTATGGAAAAGGAAAGGAAAGGAAAGGTAAAAATSEVWLPVVLIILGVLLAIIIILALVFLMYMFIISACNEDSWKGKVARMASTVGSAVGVLPSNICASLKIDKEGGAFGGGGASGTWGDFNNFPSPELSVFMTCVQNELAKNGVKYVITSVTDTNIAKDLCQPINPDEIFGDANNCQHTRFSCHYGGTSADCQKRGSYSFDIDNVTSYPALQAAVKLCNPQARYYNEVSHIHISIGPSYDCGCDVGLPVVP